MLKISDTTVGLFVPAHLADSIFANSVFAGTIGYRYPGDITFHRHGGEQTTVSD